MVSEVKSINPVDSIDKQDSFKSFIDNTIIIYNKCDLNSYSKYQYGKTFGALLSIHLNKTMHF